MSFIINNQKDIIKFALPLYDYLSQHGHADEAEDLINLVDSCYSQDAQALEAHRMAFKQIRETVHDLPLDYLHALDDALHILSKDCSSSEVKHVKLILQVPQEPTR